MLVLPTMPDIAPLLTESDDALNDYRNKALNLQCLSVLSGLPQVSIPLASRESAPFGIVAFGARGLRPEPRPVGRRGSPMDALEEPEQAGISGVTDKSRRSKDGTRNGASFGRHGNPSRRGGERLRSGRGTAFGITATTRSYGWTSRTRQSGATIRPPASIPAWRCPSASASWR